MENIYQSNRHQLSSYFAGYKLPIEDIDLDRKTIFVTGGTGFFGIWLLSLLKFINENSSVNVRAVVLSRDPDKFLTKFSEFTDASWLTWLKGDVKSCANITTKIDYIIHGATDTSIKAHNQPLDMMDTIITGTKQVLELAVKHSVKKTLLISSGAAYGSDIKGSQITEDETYAPNVTNIKSVYGESKRCMEMLGTIYSELSNLHINYARCFTFMGPELPLKGQYAFGNFIRDAISGNSLSLNSDGSSIRSYLHGADLAVWLLTVLLKGNRNEIYNVGSSIEITIKELAYTIKKLIAPNLRVTFNTGCNTSPTGTSIYVPSTGKSEQLGCMQKFSLEDGILDTFHYALKNKY